MVPCPGTDTLSPRPAPRGLQVPAPGRWLWWLSPVGPSAKRQVAFSPGANRASLGPTHPCRAAPTTRLALSVQLSPAATTACLGLGLKHRHLRLMPRRLDAQARGACKFSSWLADSCLLTTSSRGGETERGRDRSSHKDTNPVTPLPWPHLTTVTSQKPLLQIPSFLGRSLGA